MPDSLRPEQITHFRERGWIVLRGLVSDEERIALEADFDRLHRESDAPDPHALWELAGASMKSPLIARHSRNARIAECVAALLDAPRVQLLQDTLLLKPPRSRSRVEWHQDHTYLAYLDLASSVSVRLSLGECTASRGCLRVVDGSHAWGLVGGSRVLASEVIDSANLLTPELRARLEAEAHVVELAPGDVSIHHCLLFHASGDNDSPLPRKTIISRIIDGRSRLLVERLPHPAAASIFPVDEQGHLRDDEFPVLARRA
jgi:ectoine hydroxylase-related dioxygenase (phytanoyl-CoA dioxygenase family)